MRPDHACSVARLLSRVIVPAALAQALLFAWRSAASRLPVVFGAAADERFHDLASVALALAAVALGLAVGRSAPRLRRSIAAAMVGSIALLPFLHSTLLRWLSALVLALWKDEADRLIHPTDLYRLDLPDAQALASMLPLVGLASVAVVALLRWAPVRRVLVGGVLGAVAVAVAAGLAHGVARPRSLHWTDALPVTAAVRVDQIAYGQWPPGTDDRPSTALAPRVSVVRRAALGRPSVPRFWDLTVRFDLMIDDEGLEESVEMTCPAGSVLTLRSFSRSRRLLDCDPAHAARDWYRTADPAYRLIPSVARNPPSRVVRRADVLGVAAPPRAWVPLGLGGLLVAGWLLRRARRRDAAPAPLLASPYRALAAPVTGAVDGDREDLLRAAALAVAVHAAAPLVLLPWMTFARG